MKNILNEKNDLFIKKIGVILKHQREVICKENRSKFALRMSLYSNILFTWRDILAMENGSKKISIEKWMYVWMFFHSAMDVVKATEKKELLFLASQKDSEHIEQEILNYINQKNG